MGRAHIVSKIFEGLVSRQKTERENAEKNTALVGRLQEMERAYDKKTAAVMPDFGADISKSLGIEKLTYEKRGEDSLRAEAESAVAPTYAAKTAEVTEKTGKKLAEIGNDEAEAEEALSEKSEKLSEELISDGRSLEGKLVRQGITESSIAEGLEKELYSAYADETRRLLSEYEALNESLVEQRKLLLSAKEDALIGYELEKAKKVEEKLSALRTAQQTAIERVSEYNRKVAENESKYAVERNKRILELQKQWNEEQERQRTLTEEYEQTNGYTGEKATEMENRYQTALNYYSALKKDKALELIKSSEEALKPVLGLYYERLVRAVNNK